MLLVNTLSFVVADVALFPARENSNVVSKARPGISDKVPTNNPFEWLALSFRS